MDKISMTSHVRHTYNGVVVAPNDTFEANNEGDAADLEAMKFASRLPTKKAAPTYKRRDMRAESVGKSAPQPEPSADAVE